MDHPALLCAPDIHPRGLEKYAELVSRAVPKEEEEREGDENPVMLDVAMHSFYTYKTESECTKYISLIIC